MAQSKDLTKFKNDARIALGKAVRGGKLKRLPCEWPDCEDPKVQGHHYDYRYPLDVIWLCQEHHTTLHYKALDNMRFGKDQPEQGPPDDSDYTGIKIRIDYRPKLKALSEAERRMMKELEYLIDTRVKELEGRELKNSP